MAAEEKKGCTLQGDLLFLSVNKIFIHTLSTAYLCVSVLEPLRSRTCLKHHLRGLLHQLATFKDQNELNQQFLMLLFSGFVAMCSKTAVNGRR